MAPVYQVGSLQVVDQFSRTREFNTLFQHSLVIYLVREIRLETTEYGINRLIQTVFFDFVPQIFIQQVCPQVGEESDGQEFNLFREICLDGLDI